MILMYANILLIFSRKMERESRGREGGGERQRQRHKETERHRDRQRGTQRQSMKWILLLFVDLHSNTFCLLALCYFNWILGLSFVTGVQESHLSVSWLGRSFLPFLSFHFKDRLSWGVGEETMYFRWASGFGKLREIVSCLKCLKES